ncbi:STS14 protein-like [Primulina eburnea]|uniref:STS14 protein-like n=1 Tax=Primulina eburnea TaxID=1245227 RepID=UPI003C6BFCBF
MFLLLSMFTSLMLISQASTQAQPPPSPPAAAPPAPSVALPNSTQEYLEAHNQARAEVGVGPFVWSEPLAKSASLTVRLQRDKQNCTFANLSNSRYGGNQLWAGGFTVTPRIAVETWVAEKKFYTYANNSCAPEHRCGVYTQVVWKNSQELGCAEAVCPKERSSLTICFYNPPGNVIGEKPY